MSQEWRTESRQK